MATVRMDAAERKRAIVDIAMPLFARKGFAGTTTKEIAEVAGVSEALLYRHFPTKAALFEEIQAIGCRVGTPLDEVDALVPSTATLVLMIHVMFRHVVFGEFCEGPSAKTRQRLVLQSLLDDGEYARILWQRISGMVLPTFTASVAAARAAGDMRPDGIAPANAFWFAQHVAAQMAHGRVTDESVVPYTGNIDEASLEAARFCLRGMGLSEQAIAKHFHPEALAQRLLGSAQDGSAVEPPPTGTPSPTRPEIAGRRG
jgi:TetR/AcrR family transcriptional regulator, transcriptional repressor of aconitase